MQSGAGCSSAPGQPKEWGCPRPQAEVQAPELCAGAPGGELSAAVGTVPQLSLTFGFKSKVTVLAHIGPDVSVGADVFLQHAGLLAANSTLLTNIFPSAAASHIYILFV